jgi:hypothetical protein
MNFSNRLTHWAWAPIAMALVFACGGDDDGSGAGGTSGTGGTAGSSGGVGGAAGSSGAAGAIDGGSAGGASGSGGAGGAAGRGGGAGKDGGAGKGGTSGAAGNAGAGGSAGTGGAGKDGGAGKAGGAGAAPDAGSTTDVTTPPRPDAGADALPPPGDGSTDDLIRELVARIKPEEIEPRYRALEAMSLPNRKTQTANYAAATDWVKGWLATEAPSVVVGYDEWSGYRNVEIKIAGTDPAAGMYVMGGHLDSVTAAPGMDDDGSGSLGVAILASVMSHYRYKSEIRLVLFDAEESGFIGSIHYAQALQAAGCQPDTCLKLFINMDMLGYDPRDSGLIKVLFDVAAPKMVAQQMKGYVAGLTIQEGTGDCHSSDDCGFSRNGFPAGELLEPVNNPQRHTVGDICDNMNFKTLNKALQLGGAMLASMAGIHGRAP